MEYLPFIQDVCARQVRKWCVDAYSEAGTLRWVCALPESEPFPAQGWKLHVSATCVAALEILNRVVPILVDAGAAFKVVGTENDLFLMNHGHHGLSQIGKFLTVYPHNSDLAVTLASRLDAATAGFVGPIIPSDQRLSVHSPIYYRYGAFSRSLVQMRNGEVVPVLRTPEGNLAPDLRDWRNAVPAHMDDPFLTLKRTRPAPELRATPNGRYVIAATLHRSPRGVVQLALDTVTLRRVVLKRAVPGSVSDKEGLDACDRLRREASVLTSLGGKAAVPAIYEIFDSGEELVLVLEDVAGETVSNFVSRPFSECGAHPLHILVPILRKIVAVVAKMHEVGWVHRDLKPTNILLEKDGSVRLIDLEAAAEIGSKDRHSLTTRGYSQRKINSCYEVSPADDIYSLGAVIRFVMTGSDPSNYLTGCPPSVPSSFFNPAIDAKLDGIVARCLRQGSRSQYKTVDQLLRDLSLVHGRRESFGTTNNLSFARCAFKYRRIARRLGDTLAAAAQEMGRSDSNASTLSLWSGSHDLGYGLSGVAMVLAMMVRAFGVREHEVALRAVSDWLRTSEPPPGPGAPGLYAGRAGVGVALLEAGRALDDQNYIEGAAAISHQIARFPHISPDLFSGSAGRLRFHLLLWQQSGQQEHLAYARDAGAALVAASHLTSLGPIWQMPTGFGGLSGKNWLGYAHGVAGIGDSLLDLAIATGDSASLQTVVDVVRLLHQCRRYAPTDTRGLQWPRAIEDSSSGGTTWCHGTSGVGGFLLRVADLHVVDDALSDAELAGVTSAESGRWSTPVQCHGLAGMVDFLLSLYSVTGKADYRHSAQHLLELVEAFLSIRDSRLICAADLPDKIDLGYLTGVAGVAACFLHAAGLRQDFLCGH
jgi:class IV lanthipeptide synthase